MHLAVLSDVHGNLPALQAVLDDINRYPVDGLIVAGDHIGGPQANETLELLRSNGSWMIRGNSDDNLLQYAAGEAPQEWQTCRQFSLLRWAYQNLSPEMLGFLKTLPQKRVIEAVQEAPIRVVHGSPRDPCESLGPEIDPEILDLALAQTRETVLICGHTHIPWVREQNGKLALNPGAVCGSLNGDPRAYYALLRWQDGYWQAEHQAVPYDMKQIKEAFQQSSLLREGGALARAFLLSIESGKNVAEDLLSHAYNMAAESIVQDCQVVSDEIWEIAATTFEWQAV